MLEKKILIVGTPSYERPNALCSAILFTFIDSPTRHIIAHVSILVHTTLKSYVNVSFGFELASYFIYNIIVLMHKMHYSVMMNAMLSLVFGRKFPSLT